MVSRRQAALRRITLLAGCLMALAAAPAPGVVFDYSTPGSSAIARVWVPDALSAVRGVMVYGNGAGGNSVGEANNSTLRTFAQQHGFALMATGFFGNLTADSEWNLLTGWINQAGADSGRPEILNAPYLPMGFSNGGQMAYAFMYRAPERTIAFSTNKGCCYIGNGLNPPTAGFDVPGFFIAGGADTTLRRTNIYNAYRAGRDQGALWAWTEEAGIAHQIGNSTTMLLKYYGEILPLRYPTSLAPTATEGVDLLPLTLTDGFLISDVLDGSREGFAYGSLPGGARSARSQLDAHARRGTDPLAHPRALEPPACRCRWLGTLSRDAALGAPRQVTASLGQLAGRFANRREGNFPCDEYAGEFPRRASERRGLAAVSAWRDGANSRRRGVARRRP